MHLSSRRLIIAPTLAVLFGCWLAFLVHDARATVFTDLTTFDTAAAADGITLTIDNFSTYAQGNIIDGETLGSFTYTFDPNLSDPNGTQPTIGVDGTGPREMVLTAYTRIRHCAIDRGQAVL